MDPRLITVSISPETRSQADRDTFVDTILANLTVAELAHQVHLTFADNVIGPKSQNELYDGYVGNRGIGVIHDW